MSICSSARPEDSRILLFHGRRSQRSGFPLTLFCLFRSAIRMVEITNRKIDETTKPHFLSPPREEASIRPSRNNQTDFLDSSRNDDDRQKRKTRGYGIPLPVHVHLAPRRKRAEGCASMVTGTRESSRARPGPLLPFGGNGRSGNRHGRNEGRLLGGIWRATDGVPGRDGKG